MTIDLNAVPKQLFIGGAWVDSSESATFEVENPSNKRVIGRVASASVADGQRAAAAAQAAFGDWKKTAPRVKAEILRAAFEIMIREIDNIADLIVLENGKPRSEALAEVHYAAEFFRWFSEEAVRLPGHIATAPVTGRKIIETSEPIGVALLVAPWNLPAAMITRKVAPALAAGCTVVIKPAGNTAMTALYLGSLLAEAGVPDGVVNIIPTSNREVVADLLKESPVRTVSFTGSTRVGQLLMRQAVDRVVRCSMELGGNAPFIVCEDADIDLAVDSAMIAKMRHNAEACTAANRFLVHSAVISEFSEKFSARMAGLRMGDGMETSTEVGPLASASALQGINELVTAAVADGATVLTGGSHGSSDGYYYLPTVLVDVAPDAAILQEEIFGPVAPIVTFETDDEAVRLANAVAVGLGSYVHSRDLGRAMRIAEQLEVGMVGINTGIFSDPAAPFGGVKESGLGREGGSHGILEFLETKYVNVSWN